MVGVPFFAYARRIMMTFALITANFLVFFISSLYHVAFFELGFQPVYLSDGKILSWYTLVTSMFVHANLPHILGNMLVLFFVGLAFEQRIGSKRFLIIYLITGICGAITFSVVNLEAKTLLVGASGAIFGILGTFAAAYPRDEVVIPIPIGIMFITRVRVITAAIVFALFETLMFFFNKYVPDDTAHFAHLGGLVSGMILAMLLIKKEQRYTTVDYLDAVNLETLAETPEQHEMVERIKNERIPEVRRLWVARFMETVRCPRCGGSLDFTKKGVVCRNCGFRG